MAYRIRATVDGESRLIDTVNLRGDGSEESRKPLTFSKEETAQAFAENLRHQYPDVTYEVVSAELP